MRTIGKGAIAGRYIAFEIYLILVLMTTIYLRVSPRGIEGKWLDDYTVKVIFYRIVKMDRSKGHFNEPRLGICVT